MVIFKEQVRFGIISDIFKGCIVVNGVEYFFPTFSLFCRKKIAYFYLRDERNDVVVYEVPSLRPEQRLPDVLILYGHSTASLLIAQSYKNKMATTFGLIYEKFFT